MAYAPDTDTSTTVANNVSDVHGLIGATTITTTSYTGLQFANFYFVQNGTFYSVSASKSDNLAVTQHSNYTLTGKVCTLLQFNDYWVFNDAGADNQCNTSDDGGIQAVDLSLTATDPVISLPSSPIDVIYGTNMEVVGLIMQNGTTLERTDATGLNAKVIKTGITSVSSLASSGSDHLLNVDGGVVVYNDSTDTITSSLHTIAVSAFPAMWNGNNFYFFDDHNLYAVPQDGSASAALVGTDSSTDSLELLYVSGGYAVYAKHDNTGAIKNLMSMSLTDSSVLTLASYQNTGTDALYPVGLSGNRLYYNDEDYTNNVYGAGMVTLDATSSDYISDAAWNGKNISDSGNSSNFLQPAYLLLENYTLTTGVITGGDLQVYDAKTYSMLSDEGILPNSLTEFASSSFGNLSFGIMSNASTTQLFTLDTTTPGSLHVVPNPAGDTYSSALY